MPARKSHLSAVAVDERPVGKAAAKKAAAEKKTVADAAATGNHRELLVAMRERIAKTVSDPNCPPRDLAALTRRLQDIAKEIEVIDLRAKQEVKENGDRGGDETEAWDEEAI